MFFFDEAHLLFNDAPKALIEKVEQVVRLIRSKGVGVYFVTQNPLDVPDDGAGPARQPRAARAARLHAARPEGGARRGRDFRANPAFKTEEAITQLGVGEALVSTLQPGGMPSIVERAKICPPRARLGPVTPAERTATLAQSPVRGSYDMAIDRDSAFEMLQRRTAETAVAPEQVEQVPVSAGARAGSTYPRASRTGARTAPVQPAPQPQASSGGLLESILGASLGGGGGTGRASNRQSVTEAVIKSAARSMSSTVGRQVGNALVRGILGGLLRR